MVSRARLITVGDEILAGRIQDTNSKWLCERLTEQGVWVEKIVVVHDDIEQISREVIDAIESGVNYLVVSGGLGPTPDDVTVEAIAKALGRRLVKDPEVVGWMKKKAKWLMERGYLKEEPNVEEWKYVWVPEGMVPIKNDVGLAPGLLCKVGNTLLVVLPGVPKELQAMFAKVAEEYVKSDEVLLCEEIKAVGLETDLSQHYEELMKRFPGVRVGSYPRLPDEGGYITIRLYASGRSEEEVRQKLSRAKEFLKSVLPKVLE